MLPKSLTVKHFQNSATQNTLVCTRLHQNKPSNNPHSNACNIINKLMKYCEHVIVTSVSTYFNWDLDKKQKNQAGDKVTSFSKKTAIKM